MPDIRTIPNSMLFADIEKMLDEGTRVTLRIKGHSMRPFLRNDSDEAVLCKISPDAIRTGMVVLFRYRNSHVLHRVRRIQGDSIVMAGDGNYRTTENISRNDITAFAESIIRNGHRISWRSPRWRLLSLWSMAVKTARTVYHDTVAPIKQR